MRPYNRSTYRLCTKHLQWLLQPPSLLKHALSLLLALLNVREYGCTIVNWVAGAESTLSRNGMGSSGS